MNLFLTLFLPAYLSGALGLIFALWLRAEFKKPTRKNQIPMQKNTFIYSPEKRAEIALEIFNRLSNEVIDNLPGDLSEKTYLQIATQAATRAGIDLPQKGARE